MKRTLLLSVLSVLAAFPPICPAKELPGAVHRPVQLGVDRLLTSQFGLLQGKRVGVLTHKAGVTSAGRPTVEALLDRGVNVQALFAPEHGIYGAIEGGFDVANTTYRRTNIPVHSLYGKTRRPTPRMLAGLDLVLVDLQDVGARFYTYISTVCYLLEEAAKAGVEVWVLDRPNPLGGRYVGGKSLDRTRLGFTGIYPMPLLHGMTIGEVARMLNSEYGYHARLKVIEMRGWKRGMLFGDTGLAWVPPSPNLPTWESTLFYPGLETIAVNGFLAEGRGTKLPFEVVGAPWVSDPAALARELQREGVDGVKFVPIRFTPRSDRLKGKTCGGVRLVAARPSRIDPMEVPVALLRALQRLHPSAPGWASVLKSLRVSLGLTASLDELLWPGGTDALMKSWQHGIDEFQKTRRHYLIYS
ncbi:MAG: DUF1343 domain-containing protein [Candidatus Riflebacteria bacterium]|nr:DUF1343 domain-containing protein [Candidatus Riflebacteria bacterium]